MVMPYIELLVLAWKYGQASLNWHSMGEQWEPVTKWWEPYFWGENNNHFISRKESV